MVTKYLNSFMQQVFISEFKIYTRETIPIGISESNIECYKNMFQNY